MKIRLSKNNWEKIGVRAGWKKNSQTSAPVKSPTKSPVKTPTPSKSPNKNPFNPPIPKVMPQPKAIRIVEEDDNLDRQSCFSMNLKKFLKISAKPYEEGAHQSVRDFWMNIPPDHPFYQHPVLSGYGHNLSQEGYQYITQKTDLPDNPSPVSNEKALKEITGLLQQIINAEKGKEDILVEEAKNITSRIWGIDKSMLDAKLGSNEEESEGENKEEPKILPLNPQLKEEIQKRLTLNTLTQGSAVHAMNSVHYLAEDFIKKISPDLLNLYTRLSGLISQHYYTVDINAIVSALKSILSQAALGWSNIKKEDDGLKVNASGIIFPVLCQELFKGVMELLSLHGINQDLSEEELNTMYYYSDRLEDEPWLLTIGPQLWRKFLSVIPSDISLSEIIMFLSQKSPKDLHKIIISIIQNPASAKDFFEKFKKDKLKSEKEYYQDKATDDMGEIDEML